MDTTAPRIARFGLFELDLDSRELRKQGLKVKLADQPAQILLVLLERAGEPVTREELRQKLWPADTFVDFDAGVNSAIKKLRDAFGDSAETPRFIETLPRRGYRFIAPIERPPAHRDEHRPIQAEVPSRLLRRRWVIGAIAAATAVVAWLVVVQVTDALSIRNGHRANATDIDAIAVLPFKNIVADNERQRLAGSQTVRPEAYTEYLLGRYYLRNRNRDQQLLAEKQFETTIQLDPNFAPAYSALSDLYRVLEAQRFDAPRVLLPRSKAAALQALALDDTLAEAHASLAGVHYREWKWREAEQEFDRALELDPNYPEGHRARGMFLAVLRRNDEAVKAFQRARELSPFSPVINVELAAALNRAGRYKEAIQQVNRARELAPDSRRVPLTLAQIYSRMGNPSRALEELGRSTDAWTSKGPWFGYFCAVNGRREEARRVLADLRRGTQKERVSPQDLALIHLGLGEKEQALTLLEQAYREQAFELPGFSGPIADRLLDNPRFRKLLKGMNLAEEPGYAAHATGKPPR